MSPKKKESQRLDNIRRRVPVLLYLSDLQYTGLEGGNPFPGGKNLIQITEPDSSRPSTYVEWNPQDGSVKAIPRDQIHTGKALEDNDGNTAVATDKNGVKVTVMPFNVAYPIPGAGKDDPLITMGAGSFVLHVTNTDYSVKTHMITNPDGTVQPGPKWTTEAPVESANK